MGKCNEREVAWREYEHGESEFRRKLLGSAADGDELGCSLYELPPGKRSWPFHYHEGNEEAIYVLSGAGRVRLSDGAEDLAAGDYVALPAGEAGAHGVENDGDEPLRFLIVSTMVAPDVTVYPDSGKFGVYVESPPGRPSDRDVDGYYRLDDDVDYWEGEG